MVLLKFPIKSSRVITLTVSDDYGVITRLLFGCYEPCDFVSSFLNAHGFAVLSIYESAPEFPVSRSRDEMERAGALLEVVQNGFAYYSGA